MGYTSAVPLSLAGLSWSLRWTRRLDRSRDQIMMSRVRLSVVGLQRRQTSASSELPAILTYVNRAYGRRRFYTSAAEIERTEWNRVSMNVCICNCIHAYLATNRWWYTDDQGRSQQGAMGVSAPARISNPPKWSDCFLLIFLIHTLGLLQPTELFRSARGPNQDPIPVQVPLERAGAQIKSQ